MFQRSLNKVLESTEGKNVIIFGAGLHGKELAGAFIDRGRKVQCFFDNREDLWGGVIFSEYR